MENIKVSVIVPVYNSETYLKQCLDSIVTQTLKDIEIICINDGSTDDSGKILKEYAAKHNSLTILNQKNQGAGIARNKGIRAAKGKYVIFMDSDDYYPSSDVLEVLYDVAEKNRAFVVGSEFSIVFPDGSVDEAEKFKNDQFEYGYYFEREGLIHFCDYQFDYGFHRFLFLRDFLICNDICFPNLSRFQDPPFLVDALSTAENIYAVKKIGYRYRLKAEGVNWNVQKTRDLVSGILYIHDIAQKNGYDRLESLMQRRMAAEYGGFIKNVLEECLRNEEAYKKVENSISYRVGLLITYVPRKIVHLIKRNRSL